MGSGCCSCPPPMTSEHFLAALDQGLANQQRSLPSWVVTAEAAADRFLAGGRLMVGGPAPSFEGEISWRAGGLMPLTSLASAESPGMGDAALLGYSGPEVPDPELARGLTAAGTITIGFGSGQQLPAVRRACARWIDSGNQAGPSDPPVAGILDVAAVWSFVGEFVGACLRRGAMPTMFQSIVVTGADVRNNRYIGTRLHDDMHPGPVDPGALGLAYLAALRRYLEGFQATERERLAQAADEVRRTRERGNRAWFLMAGGHLPANVLGLPAGPPQLETLAHPANADGIEAAGLRPGDFVYMQGYTWPPHEVADAVHATGGRLCVAMAGHGDQPAPQGAADIVLDAQWKYGDAAVTVPGYDIPFLAPSGFLNAAIYWSLVLAALPVA